MGVFAKVYILGMFIVGYVIFIEFFRYKKEIRPFLKYGMIIGGFVIALDIFVAGYCLGIDGEIPFTHLLLLSFITFCKVIVFACVGLFCCTDLNLKGFPIIRGIASGDSVKKMITKKYLYTSLGMAAFTIGFSMLLFAVTSPRLGPGFGEIVTMKRDIYQIDAKVSGLAALMLIEIAFCEEIIYRLGVQNYIAKLFEFNVQKTYWISILFTAILWTFGHANTLDPQWVKVMQIFPLGIGLGVLFQKYGVESCILVHAVFNIAMMFFGQTFIS
ncbi:MAG: CPBP family intramembrane glutamic endopeptidase [Bacillota bacterium]